MSQTDSGVVVVVEHHWLLVQLRRKHHFSEPNAGRIISLSQLIPIKRNPMPNFRVVPKITFKNNTVVAAKARTNLKVPAGVTAYDPILVGFTTAEADVELPGAQRVGSGLPAQYKFEGGDIVLKVEIAIYIIKQYAPIPALFKRIMEHEYLHVLDYQNLAKSQITKLIEADKTLRPWLDGEPWSGSEFYDRVKDVWGTAAKKLGNILDSGAKYDVHKREIAKLAPRI
jgi:hypothetical protein